MQVIYWHLLLSWVGCGQICTVLIPSSTPLDLVTLSSRADVERNKNTWLYFLNSFCKNGCYRAISVSDRGGNSSIDVTVFSNEHLNGFRVNQSWANMLSKTDRPSLHKGAKMKQ